MLRDLDLNRQNCDFAQDEQDINKIPLTNEHGDLFLRHNDYDDCGPLSSEDGYGDYPPNQQYYNNQRPLPSESDYFYDQYVDYPINDTMRNTLNNTLARLNQTSPFVDFNQNKFNPNLPPPLHPPSSQFTFFGHPLPSLTLGNVWGTGRTASNRATSGENSSRGKGRVQVFRPGDPELDVVVNRPSNDLDSLDLKNREPAASSKRPIVDSLDKIDERFHRPYPYFQTPFSQPKPEKGFSPLIPGMSVGGFIPILDPSKNKTNEETTSNDWPDDEDLKEVKLVTKPESQSKRTPTIEKLDKIGSATLSHLTTSISPVFSTLFPKLDLFTDKPIVENQMSKEVIDEASHEYESRDANKFDKFAFDEEAFSHDQETTQRATSVLSTTNFMTSTTENIATETEPLIPPMASSTTESEAQVRDPTRESSESSEETFDNFNISSSLSADHLIAPGGIISHDLPYKAPILPVKAGKITKVASPPPPVASSNEVSKPLGHFYPQQQTSEPTTSFDNEYQPNTIFTQTFSENERISEAPQYEREDMEWYFNNYNKSQSNPILNYNRNDNRQAFGNSEHSSAFKLKRNFTAIILIVIKILML